MQPTNLRPIIRYSLFSSHKNSTISIKNIENQNNNLSNNILNNNANILTPKNNLKGNIKLKHINSTLISNNKNTNLSSENNNNTNNNIYYRTGSQVPNNKVISNKLNNEKDIQNILVENELKELKEKEIEMKNHYFLDSEKLKAILCKKRIKKNHGHKKDFKFKLKLKSDEDNELDNNRYANIVNSNDYKQLPTDINSIENNNSNNYKINIINENSSISSLKFISNKNMKNYPYYNNEKLFSRSKNRKETFNILPKIKISYTKGDMDE